MRINFLTDLKPAAFQAGSHGAWLLLVSLWCGNIVCANAADHPVFQPYVSYSLSRDDNVLRLPGSAGSSDTIRRRVAGLAIEKPLGQQVLLLTFNVNQTRFEQLSQLDYTGKSVQAQWAWKVGPHVTGTLGSDYASELAPYTNFHLPLPNLRNVQRTYFTANWMFHPEWQLATRLAHEKTTYVLTSQQRNNADEDVLEVSSAYVAKSASRASLAARARQSRDLPGASGALRFRQQELTGAIDWRASVKSRLQVICAWVDRQDKDVQSRNFSGFNSRIVATWLPASTVTATASAWHEHQARESALGGYAISQGAAFSTSWNASAKMRFDGSLRQERLRFSGSDSTSANAAANPGETWRNASAVFTYQASPRLEFLTTLYRERRSNAASASYSANGVSLQSRFNF